MPRYNVAVHAHQHVYKVLIVEAKDEVMARIEAAIQAMASRDGWTSDPEPDGLVLEPETTDSYEVTP